MASKTFRKIQSDQFNPSTIPALNVGPFLALSENLLEKKLESTKFRNPRTGLSSTLLLCPETNQVFEMHKFDDHFRSWMFEDFVLKDGGVYIVTQVDPIFLLLPYLLKNEGRFMDLDSLLHDGHADNDSDVDNDVHLSTAYCTHLHRVTLCKEVNGSSFYKYDPGKTLEWLKPKVERLSVAMEGCSRAVLPGFEACAGQDDREALRRSAWEILSHYLPHQLSAQLRQALNIRVDLRRIEDENQNKGPLKKKMKTEGPEEDYSLNHVPESKKVTKQTAAQRKLGKGDKEGLRSISSFFTKPLNKQN